MAKIKEDEFSYLSPGSIEKKMRENPFGKVSDFVLEELEEGILSLHLKPGTRLNASRISEALNVSTTPVWEAISKLQEEGLVVSEKSPDSSRSSYRVLKMKGSDIQDLFLTRMALECEAAKITAAKNFNVDTEQLFRCAEEFREGMDLFARGLVEANHPNTAALDRDFHNMIIKATNNKYLIRCYNSMDKLFYGLSMKTSYYMGLGLDSDDARILGGQHLAIAKAIESGYSKLAGELMEEHIIFCCNHLLNNI